MAAKMIIDRYYFFTLEEVRTMLVNGITLRYGPIYDRLDISVISEWCEKFNDERMEAHKKIESYENGNKNIYEIFQSETMKKLLNDTMKEIEARNTGALSSSARNKKMQQSEFEQFILRSWDAYRKRYGAFVPGRPFKGRFVDFTSFAEHKYEQLERIRKYYGLK